MNKILYSLILLTLSYAITEIIHSDPVGNVEGVVYDAKTEDPLISATVIIINEERRFMLATTTDFDGHYKFENLSPGTYNIDVKYVGYSEKRIKSILVNDGQSTSLNIKLDEGLCLDAVEVVDYKVPLVNFDNTTQGVTITTCGVVRPKVRSLKKINSAKVKKESIESLPAKSISKLAATSVGVSIGDDRSISIRGSREDATHYYVDGIRISAERAVAMVPKAEIEVVNEVVEEKVFSVSAISESVSEIELPASGQLTAAEWNPLSNWTEWEELQDYSDYSLMFDYWGLPIHSRYSVFITNSSGLPAANIFVDLIGSGDKVLWQGRTDNGGKAELWLGEDSGAEVSSISVEAGKAIYTIEHPKDISEGSNYLSIPEPCHLSDAIDILWVVDATSSMSDEINYLKSELTDVIDQVTGTLKAQNENLELRVGAVFYKDKRDDYLTAISPLNEDVSKVVEFISKTSVGGGGDTPEALDEAMRQGLALSFNSNASTKLMFVVLDAPPHHNEEVLRRLNVQAKKSAELGIKIIPITASGIDRETEYLMKQLAIISNGTYVFLTDDSGIGNPHLMPIVSDYEVEPLNDLLVRLISNYGKQEACSENAFENKTLKTKAYPNPTTSSFSVDVDGSFDRLVLTTVTGQILESYEHFGKGQRIDLSGYLSGVYYVKVIVDDRVKNVTQVIKV